MGTLATIDEYYGFIGEPVPTLTAEEETRMLAKLERASDRVRAALRLSDYTRDTDGLPAETGQRTALTRAVAAEYAAILAAGADLTGVAPTYDQISAIGVQFSRRSSGSAPAWNPATSRLSPEAAIILTEAGFFTTAVWH